MLRFLSILLALLLLPWPAAAAPLDGPKVICHVRGEYADYLQSQPAPYIEGSRMMVQVRALAETLRYGVGWEGGPRKITLSQGDSRIHLQVGNLQAEVDGREYLLEVPPRIVSDRVFIPLRFVSEALGFNVYYSQPRETAFVTYHRLVPDGMIKAICSDRDNFELEEIEFGFGYSLKETGVMDGGIKIGDEWQKVREVYGVPCRVYMNGEELKEFPDDHSIDTAEECEFTYWSSFTPYSGDLASVHCYFRQGILTRVLMS